MAEKPYRNKTTAKVYFYKQSKDTDKIDIFINPTTLDPDKPNPLKKTFGHARLALKSIINLSDLINGTLYYNDTKELKKEYTYTVNSTKDLDNKVFCTIRGRRQKTAKDGMVKHYIFEVGCQLASPSLFLNPIISLYSLLPLIASVHSRS
ncbi:hypothetical protein L208DRAFT_1265438 [Tricholoma matsutake]|nr:hypothetical protein L208DRAFT_1265438 [Tricholoma matsutake 945]